MQARLPTWQPDHQCATPSAAPSIFANNGLPGLTFRGGPVSDNNRMSARVPQISKYTGRVCQKYGLLQIHQLYKYVRYVIL